MYKKYIIDKKAVCFDLDGTIADTEPYFVAAFQKVLEKTTDELFYGDVYGIAGVPVRDRWAKLVTQGKLPKETDVNQLTKETLKEYKRLIEESPLEPRPGFWDIVVKLKEKGLKVALTTNTGKADCQPVLEKLEITGLFDFIIFGDEVKNKKPNPEIYIKTAHQLGIKTSEMLVFEDSLPGAEAAVKSGASLIVIWDGQTAESMFPKKAQLFITDFEGLAQNLDLTAEEAVEMFKKQVAEEESAKGKTTVAG